MKRVLVEDRFSRTYPYEPCDIWYPDFEGYVVDETETRFAVKKHWWSFKQWVPKDGSFSRCIEISTQVKE